MKHDQGRVCRQMGFALLASVALAGFGASAVSGQDTPQPLEVRIEESKTPLEINLRPNAATRVELSLYNPTLDELRGVSVKLVQTDGATVIGQTMEVDKVAAKGKVRVAFPKAKAPEKKEKDAPAKLETPGLAGPPFKLQLWIEARQPKEFVTIKREVNLNIFEPAAYITAKAEYDKAKRRLGFGLRYADGKVLTGPKKCPIHLVLGPEFAVNKKGTFTQALTGAEQTVDLFADDVAFTDAGIREGRAYLTVDGYERAFTYPVLLAGGGALDKVPFGQKIGARIRVPRYAKPAEKFPVYLELDGPLSPDYQVEIGMDRAGMKETFQTRKFTGLREQQIAVNLAAGGDFVCQTLVRDWQTNFDTTGVFGHVYFRVGVYKKDELVPLLIPEETRASMAVQEPGVESKRVYARVTQDETPPEGLEFVAPPKNWFTLKPMPIVVRVKKREEHQAPLDKKVLFFKGKAPPDGKIPPEAILGLGVYDAEKSTCSITVPPLEKDEALVLSVLMKTGAGIPATKTVTIDVIDRKYALATIKGTVTHGKAGQPNLPVVLGDAEGKAKASAKTNAKGEFVFEKVPPGMYVIYSQRNFPALVGLTKVEIAVGQELLDKVNVRLLAK